MKEHFSRQIDQHTYTFRRVCFPNGIWYQVHTVVQEQPIQFWIKRGTSGRWEIQPQLLGPEILEQEPLFSQAILEQETKAHSYA